jgi:hypothetical protein
MLFAFPLNRFRRTISQMAAWARSNGPVLA